jgi:hypothetical protein
LAIADCGLKKGRLNAPVLIPTFCPKSAKLCRAQGRISKVRKSRLLIEHPNESGGQLNRATGISSFIIMPMARNKLISVGAILVTMIVLAGGTYLLMGQHGRVYAQMTKGEYVVTVRHFGKSLNTELAGTGKYGPQLLSSYEFYEGSNPITKAMINWPNSEEFTVSFGNGIKLHCSWSETSAVWTLH